LPARLPDLDDSASGAHRLREDVSMRAQKSRNHTFVFFFLHDFLAFLPVAFFALLLRSCAHNNTPPID